MAIGKRTLSTVAIQFGREYEQEKMRVLVDHLNRLTSEFQRVIAALSKGQEDQVLTKIDAGDYHIEWRDPTGGDGACCDAPFLVTVSSPEAAQSRTFVADPNFFTTADGGAGGDFELTLKDNGVTYAKMQQVAGRSVLGKPTGGAGDVQEITASINGTVLTLVGGVLQFASYSAVVAAYFIDSPEIEWTYDSINETLSASLVVNSIAFHKLQTIATASLLGRLTAGTGDIEELTGTQATTLLDEFTTLLKGLVPPPGSLNDYFLRDDGVWAEASGGLTVHGVWRFDTDITPTDPGTGDFKANSATIASITNLYISSTSQDGKDADALLGMLETGYRIVFQQASDATKIILFEVTGAATDNTGWWTVPVSVVSSGGVLFDFNAKCLGAFLLTAGTGGGGGYPEALGYAGIF